MGLVGRVVRPMVSLREVAIVVVWVCPLVLYMAYPKAVYQFIKSGFILGSLKLVCQPW